MMTSLGIYVAFDEVLLADVSYQLLGMFVVTIVLISFIALFACYWPLRQFINRPSNLFITRQRLILIYQIKSRCSSYCSDFFMCQKARYAQKAPWLTLMLEYN